MKHHAFLFRSSLIGFGFIMLAASLFAVPQSAFAAPTYTGVTVRIETPDKTIYNDTVTVSSEGCTVLDQTGETFIINRDAALCALHLASTYGNFTVELINSSFGLYLNRIGNFTADAEEFWLYYVNEAAGTVGLADYDLHEDDTLLLTYGAYPNSPLRISLNKQQATTDREVIATVEYFDEYGTGTYLPVVGAVVHIGTQELLTGSDGTVRFTLQQKGTYRVFAESSGYTKTATTTLRIHPRHTQRRALSADAREQFVDAAWAYLATEVHEQTLFGSASLNEWAAMAMTASKHREESLVKVVSSYDPRISTGASTTDLARHIMAVKAIGYDPRDFHDVNYVKRLKQTMQNGQFGDEAYVNDDIFAVLALIAAGESAASDEVRQAVEYSMQAINDDGGLSFSVAATVSDVDTTAAWLQSVSNLKNYHTLGWELLQARKAAVQYLRAQQNPDGGWGYADHRVSNSASTAWAMQSLIAALEEPKLIRKNQRNGFDFLMSRQGKRGQVTYDVDGSASNEILNTIYAIMPMSLRALPI